MQKPRPQKMTASPRPLPTTTAQTIQNISRLDDSPIRHHEPDRSLRRSPQPLCPPGGVVPFFDVVVLSVAAQAVACASPPPSRAVFQSQCIKGGAEGDSSATHLARRRAPSQFVPSFLSLLPDSALDGLPRHRRRSPRTISFLGGGQLEPNL